MTQLIRLFFRSDAMFKRHNRLKAGAASSVKCLDSLGILLSEYFPYRSNEVQYFGIFLKAGRGESRDRVNVFLRFWLVLCNWATIMK